MIFKVLSNPNRSMIL